MDTTPVTLALDAQNIPYHFFRHHGQVRSLEQAAKERDQRPEQIVRSIVFRLSKDEFVMVLMAGPQQISWSKLRKFLGQSRITMASEDEVLSVTGYPLGAVSPLGLPSPLLTLVDESVLHEETISMGSGVRNTTIILRREDMLNALGDVEIGSFCKAC
ncbi:MAG: YbaK/EbsC family protein [Chloroflexota bacterium]|nr:YbaK/EbsC family protein [Chloroflexota bacterium]